MYFFDNTLFYSFPHFSTPYLSYSFENQKGLETGLQPVLFGNAITHGPIVTSLRKHVQTSKICSLHFSFFVSGVNVTDRNCNFVVEDCLALNCNLSSLLAFPK